jgi:hypothetical protein
MGLIAKQLATREVGPHPHYPTSVQRDVCIVNGILLLNMAGVDGGGERMWCELASNTGLFCL